MVVLSQQQCGAAVSASILTLKSYITFYSNAQLFETQETTSTKPLPLFDLPPFSMQSVSSYSNSTSRGGRVRDMPKVCNNYRVLTLVCTNERIQVKGSILKLMPQDSKALA